jgi:CubicO group peptidase (beta-lactamase class C family)
MHCDGLSRLLPDHRLLEAGGVGAQRVRLELLIACLTILACSHAPTKPETQELPQARPPVLAEIVAEQQRDLAAKVAQHGWPDLAVGVILEGKLVYSAGFGASDPQTNQPVTDRTLFRLASITKVFTGMALAQLQEAGKLDLDDPVSKFVPELKGVVYPTVEHPAIRIRHLVTHTSGLPRDGNRFAGMSESELLASLQGMFLEFTPGTECQYSNLGVAIAGIVVSRASGLSYRSYMQRFIFDPLDMKDTVWDPAAATRPVARGMVWDEAAKSYRPIEKDVVAGAMEPCGGLYSNVADMAKFAAFQMAAWPPRNSDESPILSRSALRESQLPAGLVIPGHDAIPGVNWWASDWRHFGLSDWHNGGLEGYKSELWLLPKRHLGVIVLSGQLPRESDGWKDPKIAEQLLAAFTPLTQAPPPELGADLSAALDRLIAWLQTRSPADAGAVFNSSMLKHLLPKPGNHCKLDRVLEGGVTHAKVTLACTDREPWTFEVRIDSTPPHLIRDWWW